MLPTMPRWAFALMVGGGLWLCLWTGARPAMWGLVPFALGALGAAMAPVPSLLVTGDGQHLALVRDDGVPRAAAQPERRFRPRPDERGVGL